MAILRTTTILFLVFFITACSSVPQKSEQAKKVKSVALEKLKLLPRNIEGFMYLGIIEYPSPWGYSSRYIYDNKIKNKKTYADVFAYPIPKEAVGYSHNNRVKGMTEHALNEIDAFKTQGKYADYKILKRSSYILQGKLVNQVNIQLVKNNLTVYSLLFLTESNNQLYKIRMSMPDNQSNRSNKTWQEFAKKVFLVLL